MNRNIFYTILFSLLLASCGGPKNAAEATDRIGSAIDSGNLSRAQSECERFFRNHPDLKTLSVDELCRMAVILADLAEDSDNKRDENAAQAVMCYRTAFEIDSVKTVEYLRTLNTDDYRHVYLLNQLLRPITDREDGVIYVSEDETEWYDTLKTIH